MSKFVVKIAGSIPITASIHVEAKDAVSAAKLAVKKYKVGVVAWDPFDGVNTKDVKVIETTQGE